MKCKKRAIRRALMRLGSLSDVTSGSFVMTLSRSFVITWRRYGEHDLVPLLVLISTLRSPLVFLVFCMCSYFFSNRSRNLRENILGHKMNDPLILLTLDLIQICFQMIYDKLTVKKQEKGFEVKYKKYSLS